MTIAEKERFKKAAMAGMLIAAALLTVYFHRVLETSTVFTHLFYIPIIFGSLWWGRRGLGIALFLAVLLIASQLLYKKTPFGFDDYLRAAVFVGVSWLVAVMRDRIRATEAALAARTAELQKRLQALSCLREINRLREKPGLGSDDIVRETIGCLAQIGFQGTGVRVCATIQGRTFECGVDLRAESRIASPVLVENQPWGELAVYFVAAHEPQNLEAEQARDLIDTVARRLGKIIEHENARADLDRHHLQLEKLVRERTEELITVNRKLREEIAERERVNTDLRESENKYRLLFENADEAILIVQDDRICLSNNAAAVFSGFSTEQLFSLPFTQLVDPADRALVSERHRKRLAGTAVPSSYAFRIRTARGAVRWVDINAVLFQWQGRPATLNYLRDITARQKIEASIGYIQKMEAIGTLAGGIAHKFNNALTGVTGNVELLKCSFPNNPAVARYCEAVFTSTHEMAGLVRQLLAYARGGKYRARVQSVLPLIEEVVRMMPSGDEKRIDVTTELSPHTPLVEVDAVQLRTVLLAVLTNAAEAIEKDGVIRIETVEACLDQTAAQPFTGLAAGRYAVLSVSDNGRGMTEDVSAHIFEPFFSTKFIGRGLGMAAAYGIIKNHGGYIYVNSTPGRGTVVRILLPAIVQPHPDSTGDNVASGATMV